MESACSASKGWPARLECKVVIRNPLPSALHCLPDWRLQRSTDAESCAETLFVAEGRPDFPEPLRLSHLKHIHPVPGHADLRNGGCTGFRLRGAGMAARLLLLSSLPPKYSEMG